MNLTAEQLGQLEQNLASLQQFNLQETRDEVAGAKRGTILTTAGLDLLSQAMAGEKLTFTRIVMGTSESNGEVVLPSDEEMLAMTELISPVDFDLPIADIRFAGNGTSILKFSLSNSNLENGFWARELGVYAKVGDGEEILYAYKNSGNLSTYIVGGGGSVAINTVVSVVTVIDRAQNVTAIVDMSVLNVTAAEFNEHIYSTNPHPNFLSKKTEVTTSTYFWATGDDNQLYPISKENLQVALGVDSNTLNKIYNRQVQSELNISNLYMQSGEQQLRSESNLFIYENFQDCESLDRFAAKVTQATAGANSVFVEDISGIFEGGVYMISDGIRNQYVRVTSVAKNDDLYAVFFDRNLNASLDLSKTYLYRTTAYINNNRAIGSSDICDSTFNFSATVWQGASSSSTQTLSLNTSQKNEKDFYLTGDTAFNADDFFTIAS